MRLKPKPRTAEVERCSCYAKYLYYAIEQAEREGAL